ncbi:MAG TPA: APC family permease, partial [Nitrososphaerales archaeon]|nr:APC family permease [Nitrososphaerales archaeon]
SMLPFGWVLGGLTAVLGITVLLVAANAGVVGISRLAYAMSEEGAIPRFFGRIHHRYRTPYLSIAIFAAIAIAIVVGFSAQLAILAEMYNFGALLAYMIVGLSLIQLRNKEKSLVRPFKAPWSIRVKGRKADADGKIRTYEVPVLAVGAFAADLVIWSLVVLLHPVGREVGALWVLLGLMIYYVYSRVQTRRTPPSVAVNFGVPDGQTR